MAPCFAKDVASQIVGSWQNLSWSCVQVLTSDELLAAKILKKASAVSIKTKFMFRSIAQIDLNFTYAFIDEGLQLTRDFDMLLKNDDTLPYTIMIVDVSQDGTYWKAYREILANSTKSRGILKSELYEDATLLFREIKLLEQQNVIEMTHDSFDLQGKPQLLIESLIVTKVPWLLQAQRPTSP